MPKRVLDFDAMWGSDKLASCAEWAQAEYAWFYGLADAAGSFEITNVRVIWGRVAAIRHNLSIERVAQIFDEFHDKGLLFQWDVNGKRYAHWTGSDVPGRLPAPSWRMRLEKLAPPVPKLQLAEYMSRFARGRASSPGGGFQQGGVSESSEGEFNAELEAGQAQDWNRDKKRKGSQSVLRCLEGEPESRQGYPLFPFRTDETQVRSGNGNLSPIDVGGGVCPTGSPNTPTEITLPPPTAVVRAEPLKCAPLWQGRAKEKWEAAAREARLGQGPACDAVRVKSEALARVRSRDAMLRKAGSGMRSP